MQGVAARGGRAATANPSTCPPAHLFTCQWLTCSTTWWRVSRASRSIRAASLSRSSAPWFTYCSDLRCICVIVDFSFRYFIFTSFIFSLYFLHPAGVVLSFFGGMMAMPVMTDHPPMLLLMLLLMSTAATQ